MIKLFGGMFQCESFLIIYTHLTDFNNGRSFINFPATPSCIEENVEAPPSTTYNFNSHLNSKYCISFIHLVFLCI